MYFVQLLSIVFVLVGHPDAGRWNDWNFWWIVIYDRTYFISVRLLVCCVSVNIPHCTDMKHIKLEINFPSLRPHPSGSWTRKVSFFFFLVFIRQTGHNFAAVFLVFKHLLILHCVVPYDILITVDTCLIVRRLPSWMTGPTFFHITSSPDDCRPERSKLWTEVGTPCHSTLNFVNPIQNNIIFG